jgi:hypothetical protein
MVVVRQEAEEEEVFRMLQVVQPVHLVRVVMGL